MFVEWESGRLVKEVEDTTLWEDQTSTSARRRRTSANTTPSGRHSSTSTTRRSKSSNGSNLEPRRGKEFTPLVHKYRTLLLEAHPRRRATSLR